MRLTMVLPFAGMSGGIRVLSIYADRLRQRGHEITIVSIPSKHFSLITKLKLFIRHWRWPVQMGSHFDDVQVRHHVLESVRPVSDDDVPDADVVLATFWKTAPWVAALSPRKGAKAILLQGYETSPGHWDTAIDAAWRLPLHKIVISKWLVQLARDRFNDPNVALVPNSVDLQKFFAPPRGKQTVPTVGFLYASVHLKGADVSIAAIDRVRKKVRNLRVVAFGAEPVSPNLVLPEWVEFYYHPSQDQIRELYSKCDVWLCGSRQEGFHLPPLEAMACRCPVVSTRVGGPDDILENDFNGFLVDVDDSEQLAKKMLKVLTMDEAEWRQMSDSALATAERYTWDDATDLLEKALVEAINLQRAKLFNSSLEDG